MCSMTLIMIFVCLLVFVVVIGGNGRLVFFLPSMKHEKDFFETLKHFGRALVSAESCKVGIN